MEEKKSYKADLEHRRPTAFLLGLVFALSFFIVMLEHTFHYPEYETEENMFDDIAQELELTFDNSREDMKAAAAPDNRKEKAQKINVVEEVTGNEVPDTEKSDADLNSEVISEGDTGKDQLSDNTSAPAIPESSNDVLDFRIVERLPEFPGGMSELVKWLNGNLRYPYIAQQKKKQGKVIVSFIINENGTVSDIKLVKGADSNLDREALRVIRMMPDWKPGEDNGKPCRTYFCIPVVFKL